jgi:hypothetical protein
MITVGSFSAKADGIANPGKIHNIPVARAIFSMEKAFIRIPGKVDSFAGEARRVFLRYIL